ncbi:MAG: DUF2334 domain-containing protein [Pseudomonadota bacterium]
MKALIAIHDVMPETLTRVEGLITEVRRAGHSAVTLLVVPGRDWSETERARLDQWQRQGMELAAHGWSHTIEGFGGLYHRLHGAFISRRAAEHLALEPTAIEHRMRAAADWFAHHGLSVPTTYVPPAWALGAIGREALIRLPYRRIEIMRGFLDPADGRLHRLPLTGYEADTPLRQHGLHAWNRGQEWRAGHRDRPLRIALHPHDAHLRLAPQMRAILSRVDRALRYDEL